MFFSDLFCVDIFGLVNRKNQRLRRKWHCVSRVYIGPLLYLAVSQLPVLFCGHFFLIYFSFCIFKQLLASTVDRLLALVNMFSQSHAVLIMSNVFSDPQVMPIIIQNVLKFVRRRPPGSISELIDPFLKKGRLFEKKPGF